MLHNVVVASRKDPKVHRRSLNWLAKCRARGLPIFAQTGTHRTGFAFTLEHWNLYDTSPAWRAVTTGTGRKRSRRCATRSCARRSSASTRRPIASSKLFRRVSADRSAT